MTPPLGLSYLVKVPTHHSAEGSWADFIQTISSHVQD